MELAVAAGDAIAALRTTYGVVVERCYVGSYAMGRVSDTAHASSGPRFLCSARSHIPPLQVHDRTRHARTLPLRAPADRRPHRAPRRSHFLRRMARRRRRALHRHHRRRADAAAVVGGGGAGGADGPRRDRRGSGRDRPVGSPRCGGRAGHGGASAHQMGCRGRRRRLRRHAEGRSAGGEGRGANDPVGAPGGGHAGGGPYAGVVDGRVERCAAPYRTHEPWRRPSLHAHI